MAPGLSAERAARNEAVFRRANERIEQRLDELGGAAGIAASAGRGACAVSDRARRVADNEQRFRVFNDEVRELRAELAPTAALACECGDAGCTTQLELTPEQYAHVRSDTRWFAVLPGHDRPDLERVIERTSRYLIVEKTGEGAVRVKRTGEADGR